ncbi:hypothetical protein Hdeb2414_s0003g00104771 [Helianthus debilis subsp. tardiflorus]
MGGCYCFYSFKGVELNSSPCFYHVTSNSIRGSATLLIKQWCSFNRASCCWHKIPWGIRIKIKEVNGRNNTSDDIILFIDEVYTLIGAGAAEVAINAANILK